MMANQFINVGDRVLRIGNSRYRYERWPSGVWLEAGIIGTVIEYHVEVPAFVLAGEFFEAIPPYAVVQWDLGEQVKTCIDIDDENIGWQRLANRVIIGAAEL